MRKVLDVMDSVVSEPAKVDEDRWITIKGTHVLVDDNGTIKDENIRKRISGDGDSASGDSKTDKPKGLKTKIKKRKIPDDYTKKTKKALQEFYDSAYEPEDLEDFLQSDMWKKTKKLYSRMAEVDSAAESSMDEEAEKEYKKEFTSLRTEFRASQKIYKELCDRLPGSNWSKLPSGSKERIQAVDDWYKSEKLRSKFDKVFSPSYSSISFFSM